MMKIYLFQIITFSFVYFSQIYCDSIQSETSFESTMITSISTATNPSYSTSSALASHETDTTTSFTTAEKINSSTHITSMVVNTANSTSISTEGFTSNSISTGSFTSNSISTGGFTSTSISTESFSSTSISTGSFTSTSISTEGFTSASTPTGSFTSASTPTGGSTMVSVATSSSLVTTQHIYLIANLTYKYVVESVSPLQVDSFTNSTILANVQPIVDASFNRSGFTIVVKRVTIQLQAKSSTYAMITDNIFTSTRSNCDINCMKNAALSSIVNITFQLPSVNGSLAPASVISTPSLVDDTSGGTTTPIVNYQTGDSPPGVAGQLGMGLGITIFSLIVIIEIVYLYRKYGCNHRPMGQTDYELASYRQHQRLSIE